MITYHKGGLTTSGANVLIHGCNCQNTMGSGVARALRAKWPNVFKADTNYSMKHRDRDGVVSERMLGTYSWTGSGNTTNPWIINLYTQYYYGRDRRHLNYEALMVGMENLAQRFTKHPSIRIAMPRIGAGLAGGDWDIIEMMINKAFGDREVEVWVL